MRKEFLNDFEELILTLVASLGENTYGAATTVEIEKWLARKITPKHGAQAEKNLLDHECRCGHSSFDERDENGDLEIGAPIENSQLSEVTD